MSHSRRTVLKWAVASATTAGLPVALAAETDAVGGVSDIVNFAWGTPPGADRDEIEHEDPAFMRELIETGDDSALEIVFADGSRLTMGENAEIVIDEFIYDPSAATGSQQITLTKGSFRYSSGAAPKDKVQIQTPAATLGIRGTEVVIDISPDGDVEAATESGEALWRPRGEDVEEVVEAGFTLEIGRDGRRRGPKRRRRLVSRSIAIAQGLGRARSLWPVRKPKRRRLRPRLRAPGDDKARHKPENQRRLGPNPDGGPNRPGPNR